jgi:hypothetical protein
VGPADGGLGPVPGFGRWFGTPLSGAAWLLS